MITLNKSKNISSLLKLPGLLCCWDFKNDDPYVSEGRYAYRLLEGNGSPAIVDDGILGRHSIEFEEGHYLYIPRKACAGLNMHGKNAPVTVLAWVKRAPKSYAQCEAIAGMWNETNKHRQYCLFLNLQLFESGDQVCGHISGVGGPTPGERWCIDASIGSSEVPYHEWAFVGFTYDGTTISSFYNGMMDERAGRNPYTYTEGIFDGGEAGSDFTVAAVHRGGEMGNFYVGQLSGLAIFDRALQPSEIKIIHETFPLH